MPDQDTTPTARPVVFEGSQGSNGEELEQRIDELGDRVSKLRAQVERIPGQVVE